MADLPQDHVSADLLPFTHVGIRLLWTHSGKIKAMRMFNSGEISKLIRYRLLHQCYAQISMSLRTTDKHPADNGTYFMGAQKELRKALRELNHHWIKNTLLRDGVKWTFNPHLEPTTVEFGKG
ncbi:hypothetical protein N1851_018677 [Merluccius polli]|uniref:Uncharacterized protein n=1 Tax=Merluccius polli TaxID=89951 RepID=A0AA47MMN2_MERPO|nr:hypothetical protein N1851_018677 [Merluccius polli]